MEEKEDLQRSQRESSITYDSSKKEEMHEGFKRTMSVQESAYERALKLAQDWDGEDESLKPEGLYTHCNIR